MIISLFVEIIIWINSQENTILKFPISWNSKLYKYWITSSFPSFRQTRTRTTRLISGSSNPLACRGVRAITRAARLIEVQCRAARPRWLIPPRPGRLLIRLWYCLDAHRRHSHELESNMYARGWCHPETAIARFISSGRTRYASREIDECPLKRVVSLVVTVKKKRLSRHGRKVVVGAN